MGILDFTTTESSKANFLLFSFNLILYYLLSFILLNLVGHLMIFIEYHPGFLSEIDRHFAVSELNTPEIR